MEKIMKNIILPEIIAVGVYNAQVVFKNKLVTPNRKVSVFEIELPIEDGGISQIDDTSNKISESTVICAKPGQTRHTRLPFKCYYIHMILKEGSLFDLLSSFPNYIKLNYAKEVKEIFVSLCEYYNSGAPQNGIMLQSLILKLIFTLNQNVTAASNKHHQKSSNQRTVEKITRYIDEHLDEDLTLEALSAKAQFSPIYFHKLFKATTGVTLREYIEEQRIKKAIDLLISTDKTLTQIAYECGFSSQAYFSCVFKRKMKLTPREYAKKRHLQYGK